MARKAEETAAEMEAEKKVREAKAAAEQKKSEDDAKQLLLENANIVKKLTDEEFSENMNDKAQEIQQRQKAQAATASDEALKAPEEAPIALRTITIA